MRWWIVLVLVATALPAPGETGAPPTHTVGAPLKTVRPARGRFLVATRSMVDPEFAECVALLLDADDDGATAVVINRPSDVKLSTLLPAVEGLRERSDVAFLGGPVLPTHLVVLMRGKPVGGTAERLFADVHVLTARQAIRDALAAGLPRQRLRAYVGHAGWAPGQLDAEIEDGDWMVIAADPGLVFADHAETVWSQLIERSEGSWTRTNRLPRVASAP